MVYDENSKKADGSSSGVIIEDENLLDAENHEETQSPSAVVENIKSGTEDPSSNIEEDLHKRLYQEFFPNGITMPKPAVKPEMLSGTVIKIENLCKNYKVGWAQHKKYKALDNVSFDVKAGEIFGFIGPNGAGKTTTIKALIGITRPDSGTIEIFGEKSSSKDVRRHVGYFPEISYYHKYLTAEEAITYYGRLCGLSGIYLEAKVKSLLETTGLYEHRNKLLKSFSKGMLQRIGLAQALVNDPALLIMDEPTSGLDPLIKKEMRDLILSLNSEGRTIFLSSHELSEVEMICHRVAILDKGKIIAQGALDEILPNRSGFEITAGFVSQRIVNEIRKIGGILETENSNSVINCENQNIMYSVLGILAANSCEILDIKTKKQTLEDFFVTALKSQGGTE